MRGTDQQQTSMLTLVTLEQRVPAGHPLRRIKILADQALAALSPTFAEMYSRVGRPSVPPERFGLAPIQWTPKLCCLGG